MNATANLSQAARVALLSLDRQAAFYASLSSKEATDLEFNWRFWARPNQLPPPGEWFIWLLQAGRGFGKTRTGAEWVRDNVSGNRVGRIALVAPTAADARDVMVEGPAGILACSPPWDRPDYAPSKRRLIWPNGAIGMTFSADEPDRLRGPAHDLAWADEAGSWRYPEAWDMLMLGLRDGVDPRVIVTTTPKPTRLIREIRAEPGTVVTRGSTYENRANLAPNFLRKIISKYEGTRLGRQELLAELLEDIPGALWTLEMIDGTRARALPAGMLPGFGPASPGYCRAFAEALNLRRIVVAVDPSGASGEDDENADEIGIVAAGVDRQGHGHVLEDASGTYSPEGWGSKAVDLYDRWGADRILGERNFGGAMVESTIRAAALGNSRGGMRRQVPVTLITASRGKAQRAEPVAALYERGMVHHQGSFAELEEQLLGFTRNGYEGDGSPDRADAAVFAISDLMLQAKPGYDIMAAAGMR